MKPFTDWTRAHVFCCLHTEGNCTVMIQSQGIEHPVPYFFWKHIEQLSKLTWQDLRKYRPNPYSYLEEA